MMDGVLRLLCVMSGANGRDAGMDGTVMSSGCSSEHSIVDLVEISNKRQPLADWDELVSSTCDTIGTTRTAASGMDSSSTAATTSHPTSSSNSHPLSRDTARQPTALLSRVPSHAPAEHCCCRSEQLSFSSAAPSILSSIKPHCSCCHLSAATLHVHQTSTGHYYHCSAVLVLITLCHTLTRSLSAYFTSHDGRYRLPTLHFQHPFTRLHLIGSETSTLCCGHPLGHLAHTRSRLLSCQGCLSASCPLCLLLLLTLPLTLTTHSLPPHYRCRSPVVVSSCVAPLVHRLDSRHSYFCPLALRLHLHLLFASDCTNIHSSSRLLLTRPSLRPLVVPLGRTRARQTVTVLSSIRPRLPPLLSHLSPHVHRLLLHFHPHPLPRLSPLPIVVLPVVTRCTRLDC